MNPKAHTYLVAFSAVIEFVLSLKETFPIFNLSFYGHKINLFFCDMALVIIWLA